MVFSVAKGKKNKKTKQLIRRRIHVPFRKGTNGRPAMKKETKEHMREAHVKMTMTYMHYMWDGGVAVSSDRMHGKQRLHLLAERLFASVGDAEVAADDSLAPSLVVSFFLRVTTRREPPIQPHNAHIYLSLRQPAHPTHS